MMQKETVDGAPQHARGIIAILLCAAVLPGAQAADYRYGYPDRYFYPNDGYGLHENLRLRSDINRLGAQMRRQQRQFEEQERQQQEQTRLLRQQRSAQQRLTAMQACYDRFNGGLDLCDRLFDAASKKHAACTEAVVEINPGCAAEITRSASKRGE